MSTNEIISLANSIVKAIMKGERFKMPRLEGWELDEVLWWIKNLEADLI